MQSAIRVSVRLASRLDRLFVMKYLAVWMRKDRSGGRVPGIFIPSEQAAAAGTLGSDNGSARWTDVADRDSKSRCAKSRCRPLAVLSEPSAVSLFPERTCLFAKVQDDSE